MKNLKKNTQTKKANNNNEKAFKFLSDIELSKLSDKEFEAYLDSMNESQLTEHLNNSKEISSFSKKKKNKGNQGIYKKSAYKDNETSKRFRQRIREKRDNILTDVIDIRKTNNKDLLKTSIDKWEIFYKDTYILNDYTVESVARKNSDDDTKRLIKEAFNIIKRYKSSK